MYKETGLTLYLILLYDKKSNISIVIFYMFSAKKLLLIGFILILLVAIPLTLYFIQQQQEIRSRAQAATTLSFTPSTSSVNVGDVVSLDLMVNPNSNLVSFVRLEILYDSIKLATASGNQGKAFEPNNLAFPSITEGPIYEDGRILVTLSVGSDPTKAIQTPTKVATFQFIAKEPTETPTQVTLGTQTQVLSIGPEDQASENVLASTSPAAISIGGGPLPTSTPTPTPTATPTPTTTVSNTLPVCSTFTATVASSSAPVDVTFNVVGSDADGTIEKITINYGDNNVINYTENLGVKNVNTTYTHTYTSAGQYTAQALLTDDQGGVSSAQSCKTTVTIAGEPTATPTGTLTPTATSTPTATPTTGVDTPTPTMEAPGPGSTVIGIGAFFTVLSIIGAILFFTL